MVSVCRNLLLLFVFLFSFQSSYAAKKKRSSCKNSEQKVSCYKPNSPSSKEDYGSLRRAFNKVKKVTQSCARGVVLGATAGGMWNLGANIQGQETLGEALSLKMQNILVASAAGASIGLFYAFAQSTMGLGLKDMADILSRYANIVIKPPEDEEEVD